MDRTYPYTRRLNQRTRLQRRVALALAASVAACVVLYGSITLSPDADSLLSALPATPASATPAAPAQASSLRRVYPYSIVPGGVSGASELARVIRTDKVVAAHYAEFNVDKAREATVTTPRAVHVSYRKGDKVYWTAKKVMLAQGETMLSDGSHEVRARCANRISDTPQLPVEAHAPSTEELDSSELQQVAGADADGGMENVSLGMPGDADGGRAGGFLHAAGSGGAGGASGGSAAVGSGGGGHAFGSASGAVAGMGRVANGGSVSGKSSSTTGTHPVPGATAPVGATPAPLPNQAGNSGNNSSGAPALPGTPAGPAPAAPGATVPVAQPGNGLPSTSQPPASATPPAPGAGLPDTSPGLPSPGTTPDAPSPGSPPVATPAAPMPGIPPSSAPLPTPVPLPLPLPLPLPGRDPVSLPGNQAGGGGNSEHFPVTQPPATQPPAGGTIPSTGGAPGELPIPDPVVKPPELPATPADDPTAPTPIPEPGSLWLAGAGLLAILARRRR